MASSGRDVIAGRYEVVAELGRGGMACVYRVHDRSVGREIALKQLLAPNGAAPSSTVAALFEREFQTLAQLRHPHVIAVYDFGVLPDANPYYTMELLDGGDLRERAPLPWREVCRLFLDVCSSLALLHSRRLLHRDIRPRNIRCTHDGHAKLIDFGAMAPMSAGGADIVGTPAFVAPETVHRLALDARTDLFSLGVTLYYALTARLPYTARTFADTMAAWGAKVAPPSSWRLDIPPALDDLVLALISVEPALRPASAFEVMQRLAVIAGVEASESSAVSAAYLATPTLIGREPALMQFRQRLLGSRLARGGALLISGSAGLGRSRLLDACALEAKTLGFTVVRASAGGAREAFATVRALLDHVLDALPRAELGALPGELFEAAGGEERPKLKSWNDPALDTDALQTAFCRFWLRVSRKHPLLIGLDDVHRIDPASAAMLVALLDKARGGGIFMTFTADADEPASDALQALSRRSTPLVLEPMTDEQTRELLRSVFGDASNLEMLAREIHEVALGNPRQTMELAQHLVDRGILRYALGTWTLPQRLAAEDLPRNASDALRARVLSLSPYARFLGEAQALAFRDNLRDQEYHALLPGVSSELVERALSELLQVGALVGDGDAYRIANRLWLAALRDPLTRDERLERHRALAASYRAADRVAFIYHAFAGELDAEGHEALAALNAGYAVKLEQSEIAEQNVAKMMQCYARAFESAQQVGISARALNELRRWNLGGSVTVEAASYPESARLWRTQLERDTGLDLYRADPDTSDPMQRLMRALTGAQARYAATPEAERVYTVEEAIKLLAEYVVFCIALGGRCNDREVLRPLPGLLEPFVALSPLLEAIWNNARATCANRLDGNKERARELWQAVLVKLDAMDETALSYVKAIANAVAYGIGNMEAQLGLPSALAWADRLERDPYQRVSALQLRRIVRLEQGDSKGAERYRRQAEVLALQSRVPQMFGDLVFVELVACAHAGDLAGVQDALERMRPNAERHPGWRPMFLYAEACSHRARGDHEQALRKCEECIAIAAFDARGESADVSTWLAAESGRAEALLALGRVEEARAGAANALEQWRAHGGQRESWELEQVLAVAEAKLGMPSGAERLDALLAQQAQRGVTGLRMGMCCEARAQVAIWQRDAEAFERYAELTAREYRYGAESALGARYQRLLNEAARSGMLAKNSLAELVGAGGLNSSVFTSQDMRSVVGRTMEKSGAGDQRARAALQLICASRVATRGHLYLRTATGLSLAASVGDQPPLPLAQVQEFATRVQERAEDMDDMATGELLESPAPETLIAVGDVGYELLLLSCSVDDETRVAGVAAVANSGIAVDLVKQAQLLQVIATHLLEASS
ncbi:MAG TPA: protein kinase [Polyangiales bacterium]|nr:protein kinase [Polyangiales bacterium]